MELATQYHQYSSTKFDFNSGRTSPRGRSSPSTPRAFGDYYFSAPTSPAPYTGMIHREVEGYSYGVNYTRGLFPCTVESDTAEHLSKDDYTINRVKAVSKGGKHKRETIKSPLLYPISPNSTKSQHKKNFWSSFSPKRKKDFHSREAIVDNRETRRTQRRQIETDGRGVVRSLSPTRDTQEEEEQNSTQIALTSKPPSTPLSSPSSSKGSRKWKLKDFLLFRSASEGRASDKDPLRKYSYIHWKHDQVAKNSLSSQSNEGSSVTPTRKGPVSAHELHYTVNKAISQDMKKKSFLPYKQGILGRLAINPTVHALANGFGSLSNSHG